MYLYSFSAVLNHSWSNLSTNSGYAPSFNAPDLSNTTLRVQVMLLSTTVLPTPVVHVAGSAAPVVPPTVAMYTNPVALASVGLILSPMATDLAVVHASALLP